MCLEDMNSYWEYIHKDVWEYTVGDVTVIIDIVDGTIALAARCGCIEVEVGPCGLAALRLALDHIEANMEQTLKETTSE